MLILVAGLCYAQELALELVLFGWVGLKVSQISLQLRVGVGIAVCDVHNIEVVYIEQHLR